MPDVAAHSSAAGKEATERMSVATPGVSPAPAEGMRHGPSATLIAVIALLVVAGGAGLALALVAGGQSGHAVHHALVGVATSPVVTEAETTSSSSAAASGASAAPAASGHASRVFHTPSGNVICEVRAAGASCSVASNDRTFVLPDDGGASHIESGMVLSIGSGSLADYGTSVSVGSVTCVVPVQREPRGITCDNSESGHGFEASKDTSRQKTY